MGSVVTPYYAGKVYYAVLRTSCIVDLELWGYLWACYKEGGPAPTNRTLPFQELELHLSSLCTPRLRGRRVPIGIPSPLYDVRSSRWAVIVIAIAPASRSFPLPNSPSTLHGLTQPLSSFPHQTRLNPIPSSPSFHQELFIGIGVENDRPRLITTYALPRPLMDLLPLATGRIATASTTLASKC